MEDNINEIVVLDITVDDLVLLHEILLKYPVYITDKNYHQIPALYNKIDNILSRVLDD
jgi:hypothetical protein